MTNFVAALAFISTGWTSKSLYMWAITTLAASVFPCVIRIKSSLFLWFSWFLIIKRVGFLPKLEGFIFLLGLTGWYLCALMSQEINLYCLWVSCNLFDMLCCSLGTFHFLQAGALYLQKTCLIQHALHSRSWKQVIHF